jgi:hypothetical protein
VSSPMNCELSRWQFSSCCSFSGDRSSVQNLRCHGKRDSIELFDLETCENLIEKISFRLNKCDGDEMINHCGRLFGHAWNDKGWFEVKIWGKKSLFENKVLKIVS